MIWSIHISMRFYEIFAIFSWLFGSTWPSFWCFSGLETSNQLWASRFPTCSNCADLTIIAKCPQGPRACLSSEFLMKVGMLQKKSAPTISVFFLLQDTQNQAVPVDFSLMDPGWEDFLRWKRWRMWPTFFQVSLPGRAKVTKTHTYSIL